VSDSPFGKPRNVELARGFRGLRIDVEHYMGDQGAQLLIDAGDIRIEIAVIDINKPLPMTDHERILATLIASVLRNLGVARGMLLSPYGRVACWALAKHSMGSRGPDIHTISDHYGAFVLPKSGTTTVNGVQIRSVPCSTP